jgi:hypothetical protein
LIGVGIFTMFCTPYSTVDSAIDYSQSAVSNFALCQSRKAEADLKNGSASSIMSLSPTGSASVKSFAAAVAAGAIPVPTLSSATTITSSTGVGVGAGPVISFGRPTATAFLDAAAAAASTSPTAGCIPNAVKEVTRSSSSLPSKAQAPASWRKIKTTDPTNASATNETKHVVVKFVDAQWRSLVLNKDRKISTICSYFRRGTCKKETHCSCKGKCTEVARHCRYAHVQRDTVEQNNGRMCHFGNECLNFAHPTDSGKRGLCMNAHPDSQAASRTILKKPADATTTASASCDASPKVAPAIRVEISAGIREVKQSASSGDLVKDNLEQAMQIFTTVASGGVVQENDIGSSASGGGEGPHDKVISRPNSRPTSRRGSRQGGRPLSYQGKGDSKGPSNSTMMNSVRADLDDGHDGHGQRTVSDAVSQTASAVGCSIGLGLGTLGAETIEEIHACHQVLEQEQMRVHQESQMVASGLMAPPSLFYPPQFHHVGHHAGQTDHSSMGIGDVSGGTSIVAPLVTMYIIPESSTTALLRFEETSGLFQTYIRIPVAAIPSMISSLGQFMHQQPLAQLQAQPQYRA